MFRKPNWCDHCYQALILLGVIALCLLAPSQF